MLRRVDASQINIWLACSTAVDVQVRFWPTDHPEQTIEIRSDDDAARTLQAGTHLFYLMLSVCPTEPLPLDKWIEYDLSVRPAGSEEDWQDHRNWAPHLTYPELPNLRFCIPERVTSLLHGSCRKPHFQGADGLAAADQLLHNILNSETPLRPPPAHDEVIDEVDDEVDQKRAEDTPPESSVSQGDPLPAWPSLLIMSGDQIYADDVAGPMLQAIHQVIDRLGLYDESFQGLKEDQNSNQKMAAPFPDSAQGLYNTDTLYQRKDILPTVEVKGRVTRKEKKRPIFTSVNVSNHLISLAELCAMYLLVWSPTLWSAINLQRPTGLSAQLAKRYDKELASIHAFAKTLPQVQRLLAHVPTAMIFDDHDITDDWNLSREWEAAAYDNAISRRMIGNGLVAYLVHQAWGNQPELLDKINTTTLQEIFKQPGCASHDHYIDELFGLEQWDYEWQCDPPLIVLDTRTRRWRAESSAKKPSGLLDWEAITDLQRNLRGKDRVLLVSAAPIFGVKLIETIQSTFAAVGKPLLVDAEYWLAHRGTTSGVLNVFRHRLTPKHFVVLSGDVHYSFVYDVELRGERGGPDIWQICSSGLCNEFPNALLRNLDHLNRWLYSPRSPLNWFTQRRKMRVIPRKPVGTAHGRRILNGSGIGVVELDNEGAPWRIRQLLATDGRLVDFVRREEEARWD